METVVTFADLGPEVVSALADALQVDADWTVREDRGFSWWGHRLRQRVWADPVRESHGEQIVHVHAKTDVLVDVEPSHVVLSELAQLNELADLSALILEPGLGRVSMQSNAYLHAGNRWILHDLKSSVALQAAESAAVGDELQKRIGGRVAESGHPISGRRAEPDNMLEVGAVFRRQGSRPTGFVRGDFSEAAREAASFVVIATYDESALAAEIPYRGRRPVTLDHEVSGPVERRLLTDALIEVGRKQRVGAPAAHSTIWLAATSTEPTLTQTALLQIRSAEPHPALGRGLVTLLWLPAKPEGVDAARLANQLNVREATEWTEAHLLGAWSTRDGHLVFTSFTPNLVLANSDASTRRARLINNVIWSAIRARWAAEQLAASQSN